MANIKQQQFSNNNSGDSKPRYMADYTHNGDSSKQTEVDARAAVNGNVNGSAKIKIAYVF